MSEKSSRKWFLLCVVGVLLAAPNATVIKNVTESTDPLVFIAMRFLVIALITSPFVYLARKKYSKANVRYALMGGMSMSVSVMCYVNAISLSKASYVSIITLLTPIVFMFYSVKLAGDKISRRAIAGITLAAIGAMVIFVLPIAFKQGGEFIFYPTATLLAIINSLVYPLAIVGYKKSNEAGMPMIPLMSISAWIIASVGFIFMLVSAGLPEDIVLSGSLLFGIAYSGIMVALISRIISVASYEHIGAVPVSVLTYLENFLSIALPLLILGEVLSPEMVVGGVLILSGVYLVEHHKSSHHKHHTWFKNH